jgi:hypothetical protein
MIARPAGYGYICDESVEDYGKNAELFTIGIVYI